MLTLLRYIVMAMAALVENIFLKDQRALERDQIRRMRLQAIPVDSRERD